MKVLCKTSSLLEALQLANRAIGNQQALPILHNVLIHVEGRRCTISATDLELSIITYFEAAVENEGVITIPTKTILNFVQYNSDEEILLETIEGTQLRCTSLHSKATIAGEGAGEYPKILPGERQTSIDVLESELLHGLHLTTFAAAKSPLRPVLSGVYWRTEKNITTLVTTDSYRLSEYKISIDGESEGSHIIPVKVLDELKGIIGGRWEEKGEKEHEQSSEEKRKNYHNTSVYFGAQQVEFYMKNTHIFSRLIEGRFPSYEQIIPQEWNTKVQIPTKDFATTVRRMHFFAKEMNNNLTLSFSSKGVRITSPNTQIGKEESFLTAEVEGGENTIALSSSYLLDFLGHVDSENVEMCITDSVHPAIFHIPHEKNFLHLIMPLRLMEG